MAKTCGLCTDVHDKTGDKEVIHSSDWIHADYRFLDALFCFTELKNPWKARPWEIPERRDFLPVEIVKSLELFVAAHEYAHLCLAHQAIGEQTILRDISLYGESQITVEEEKKSREQEFQADEAALSIVMASGPVRRLLPGLLFVGIDFLFSLMELLDQTSEGRRPRTHPTPAERRENLRHRLEETHPDHAHFNVGDAHQETLKKLWERNEERYYRARAMRKAELYNLR